MFKIGNFWLEVCQVRFLGYKFLSMINSRPLNIPNPKSSQGITFLTVQIPKHLKRNHFSFLRRSFFYNKRLKNCLMKYFSFNSQICLYFIHLADDLFLRSLCGLRNFLLLCYRKHFLVLLGW